MKTATGLNITTKQNRIIVETDIERNERLMRKAQTKMLLTFLFLISSGFTLGVCITLLWK